VENCDSLTANQSKEESHLEYDVMASARLVARRVERLGASDVIACQQNDGEAYRSAMHFELFEDG
jgi:hypothetical protein